jgi:hypothetical protein
MSQSICLKTPQRRISGADEVSCRMTPWDGTVC